MMICCGRTEQGFFGHEKALLFVEDQSHKIGALKSLKMQRILHRGQQHQRFSANSINVFRPPDHRSRDVSVKLRQLAISHFNLRFRLYCTFAALPE